MLSGCLQAHASLANMRAVAQSLTRDLADKLQLAAGLLGRTNEAAEIRDLARAVSAVAEATAAMQRLMA